MHVPTTLFAFTNSPQDSAKIVSAEFQKPLSKVIYLPFPRDANGLPDWDKYQDMLYYVSNFHSK